RLAGIPDSVLRRASEILNNLEKEEIDPGGRPKISRTRVSRSKEEGLDLAQIELFSSPADELLRDIQTVDVNQISPIEALNMLWELKKKYSKAEFWNFPQCVRFWLKFMGPLFYQLY
ncbi:MAG: mismatch repair protein MutS, partial [Thermodesulfobacteriota bacterium]|nr:mismatch repair protein MutS [Thermodesulfobacteriota bacterium]